MKFVTLWRRLPAGIVGFLFAAAAPLFADHLTPLRIEQTVEPQFPAALAFSPVTDGEARIVINVDDRGKLADLLVAGYTDKAFADEAVSSLKLWRYEPARVDGQPVGVRMELRFKFIARGRVVSLSPSDTMSAMFHQLNGSEFTLTVCPPGELDQPVRTVETISPYHPGGRGDKSGASRSVMVDFYVDQSGRPRMPVVTNSPQAAYAQAAVDALAQWRFTPPTRAGKPVAVKLHQEFIFHARS